MKNMLVSAPKLVKKIPLLLLTGTHCCPNYRHCAPRGGESIQFLRLLRSLLSLAMTVCELESRNAFFVDNHALIWTRVNILKRKDILKNIYMNTNMGVSHPEHYNNFIMDILG